ncbi:MAG: hypothetical protein H6748_00715 [Spirochaetaceae bacterium]|nr:hypothetical protein [Myxococcales bacterium]MCB9722549.1 hypothetical protein [Spirochaetaceae bacterium]HPG28878.1 hypothetical protein [Myxococcota bacterium]
MAKRPFFVQPDGECIPLEGDWRIAWLRGEWYVLGHHSVVPCGSERAARSMLEELRERTDVDRLAAEAIASLDRIPDRWETDSLEELEPARD